MCVELNCYVLNLNIKEFDMRNVIAVNVLLVLVVSAQASGAYWLISKSEVKSNVVIAKDKVAHKFPVTTEGFKLPNESYTVCHVIEEADLKDGNNVPLWSLLDTDQGVVFLTHGGADGKIIGIKYFDDDMLVDDAVRVLNDRYKVKIDRVICCYPKQIAETSKTGVLLSCAFHDGCVYVDAARGNGCVVRVWTSSPN